MTDDARSRHIGGGGPIMGGPALLVVDKERNGVSPIGFDASGSFADRSLFNDQLKGYVYLSIDPLPFTLYVKRSNTVGDWSAGQPIAENIIGFQNAVDAALAASIQAQNAAITATAAATTATTAANSVLSKMTEYNVKDYGAIGDGVVRRLSDLYGTLAAAKVVYPAALSLTEFLDGAAFTKAINAAAVTGGRVVIPRGRYRGGLLVNKFNVDVAGTSATIINPPSGVALDIQNITNFGGGVVRDLKLSGADGDGTVDGIRVGGSSHFLCEAIDVNDVRDGLWIEGDKSKEITFNDLIITKTSRIGFEYYHANDVDSGGVYLWNLRIAGFTDEATGDPNVVIRRTGKRMKIWSDHTPRAPHPVPGFPRQGLTATGMVFAVNTVLDGCYERALEIINIDGVHFVMLYVSGTLSNKGLLYFQGAKDTQIHQAWVQNSAPRAEHSQPTAGHCVEFGIEATNPSLYNIPGTELGDANPDDPPRHCFDLQFGQMRLSCLGYDWYYAPGSYPVRSRFSDIVSTSRSLGGRSTNDYVQHAYALREVNRTGVPGTHTRFEIAGTTAEIVAGETTIPKEIMGANGRIEINFLWSCVNSANVKTIKTKFNGTNYVNYNLTTSETFHGKTVITNRNSPAVQCGNGAGSAPYGASASPLTGSGWNTDTTDIPIQLTGQLSAGANTALEYLRLERFWVDIYPDHEYRV